MRRRAAPSSISPVLLEPPLSVPVSGCCCPLAPGSCRPPYDQQPASLTVRPVSFSVAQQAAAVLAGAALEHLCAGDPLLAAQHTERLAALLDLI